MVFPVVMYGCENWTIMRAEHQRIDAFELWCWRRLLKVPWTASRANQSILRKSVLNIRWKDWCWCWSSNTLATFCKVLTHWKRPWGWEILKAGVEGDKRGEDEMFEWRHWSDGHEFEQAPEVDDGQGSLACCSPLGCKELEMTDWLNWLNDDLTIK